MRCLRSAWYVAAIADALAPGQLPARALLGEARVFFRQADGRVEAPPRRADRG